MDSAVLQQKEGREGGKEGRRDGPPTCVAEEIIVLFPEEGVAFCHLASQADAGVAQMALPPLAQQSQEDFTHPILI